MTAPPRVAVVHLGRPDATGESRRVETWQAIFESAGAAVTPLRLLAPGAGAGFHPHVRDVLGIVRGEIVPEAGAWSPFAAARRLAELRPHVTVFVTARAFRPVLLEVAGTPVLDLVDALSVSYADRAVVERGHRARSLGYRLLASAHERFERQRFADVRRTAAGYADAEALGAEWVPVVVPPLRRHPRASPMADLAFIGNLAYPPNVDAVQALDRMWPKFNPGTTLLLAGRRPTPDVRDIAARRGWSLLGDFEDLSDLTSVARVAVAPLRFTAGIQNKVLDAAALGMPQVVTPPSLRGLAPGFPAVVADLDGPFVRAVEQLLSDDDRRTTLAAEASGHLDAMYRASAWVRWARPLLRGTRA